MPTTSNKYASTRCGCKIGNDSMDRPRGDLLSFTGTRIVSTSLLGCLICKDVNTWPTLKMISGIVANEIPRLPKYWHCQILSLQPCDIVSWWSNSYYLQSAYTICVSKILLKVAFIHIIPNDTIVWNMSLPFENVETRKQLGIAQIQLGCQQSARSPDCRFYPIWRPMRMYLYAPSHFPREAPPWIHWNDNGHWFTTTPDLVQLTTDNKDITWLG